MSYGMPLVAWFMVGLYLSHSGALDGARPVGSTPEPFLAPHRGLNQTHLGSGLDPGKTGQVFCITALSLTTVVILWCDVGAFHSHCCLSVFQVRTHCRPMCSPVWGTGHQGGRSSSDWHKVKPIAHVSEKVYVHLKCGCSSFGLALHYVWTYIKTVRVGKCKWSPLIEFVQ